MSNVVRMHHPECGAIPEGDDGAYNHCNCPEVLLFKVGDHVRKVTGDYSVEGFIVAAFHKDSGHARYVVETDTPPGLLMIYRADQLVNWPGA